MAEILSHREYKQYKTMPTGLCGQDTQPHGIQTISGQTKLPKFDKLWAECTQEETRIAACQRLHGIQPKENQAFVSHAKKGNVSVRKSFNHKHQDKRSSPPPDQKKQEKKDLSQIQCYRCKKYGHYANSCRS